MNVEEHPTKNQPHKLLTDNQFTDMQDVNCTHKKKRSITWMIAADNFWKKANALSSAQFQTPNKLL